MKQLLNTVYVSDPDVYLALKGKNLNLIKNNQSIARIPLHNLEAICTFGHQGASPALIAACMEQNISLTFFNNNGKFRGRLTGKINGNVAIRKQQYRVSDNEGLSLEIAKHMIVGKIFNIEHILKRTIRDHALRVDVKNTRCYGRVTANYG